MRWMLTGCCSLALISLSVAINSSFQVKQRPRFYGMKTGRSVIISCISEPDVPGTAEWYKANQYDVPWEKRTLVQRNQRINFQNKSLIQNGFLIITDLQTDDSAVYFCKINNTPGPGTQIQAAKLIDRSQAQHRTNLKDGLIVLQGLMFAMCLAAILMRRQKLQEKNDSFYEEPDTDNIYQDLDINVCEGGLYEELSVYAQADGAEAPWE